MHIKSDEPGVGRWRLRERTADESILELTFSYPDGSNTTTSRFIADGAVPADVRTEAGTFTLSGDEHGGDVAFDPSPEFVAALRERGLRVYLREVLACAMSQVPLAYVLDALTRLSNAEIIHILGMHMVGATEDDITSTLAKIPDASPTDVMMECVTQKHKR